MFLYTGPKYGAYVEAFSNALFLVLHVNKNMFQYTETLFPVQCPST